MSKKGTWVIRSGKCGPGSHDSGSAAFGDRAAASVVDRLPVLAELGQLENHYHQNDDDQDPDDDPDDSSVHFASFDPRGDPPLQIRSLNTSLWLASKPEARPGLNRT